ncbi:TatD-related deoxyribonuclease [Halorubrum trapanicum]|uniref:TatD-related deoxyribonuclease n=1 Tax=Halorubrum trapanicum TaxID=29284 RepID=A0A8J7R6T7_9EURY|nr:TatD family hydrolase [Halorubrum trapanicum]MBP1901007.1 TatD-related deoxyribonuclease [Halorubrum trapanicum]
MTEDLGTPVLDNHLHLDPRHGRGIEAVEEFVRLGGTHLLVVNKPSWLLGVEPDEPADFRAVFEETLETVAAATEALPGRAWPVLGVHPGLISRLVDERDFSPTEARDLMRGGLEVASEYVADGDALALKSGRPHYDVTDAVWEASNAVTRRAFELGAEVDCAVQLHTEATEDLTDLAAVAEEAGLDPSRVVKHYAAGELAGVTPSVMSDKDRLERAAEAVEPFLMETDFVDDPDRPGMVLGPKTVPRRVRWLLEEGYDEAVRRAHVETPRDVYGIDTEATLERSES